MHGSAWMHGINIFDNNFFCWGHEDIEELKKMNTETANKMIKDMEQ